MQLTLTGGRPLLESRLMPPGGSMTLTGGTPIITNSVVPVAIGTVELDAVHEDPVQLRIALSL
ncbi:hypothetical protein RA989_21050, partial [Mycobacteroides abscessus subsp. massiliense]